jgi:hypothetical protein
MELAAISQKQPEFPGGVTSNYSLQGTRAPGEAEIQVAEVAKLLHFRPAASGRHRRLAALFAPSKLGAAR